MRSFTFLVVLLALPAIAKEKPREWQEGVVRETNVRSFSDGATVSRIGTTVRVRERRDVYEYVTIEAPETTYHVARELKWRWSNPGDFIINEKVDFAVEGRKFFVVDASRKVQEYRIAKQIKR